MLAVNVDLDKLDRFPNLVSEAVVLANAVRHEGVVVELLDVVGRVATDRGVVVVMGQRRRINPCRTGPQSWGCWTWAVVDVARCARCGSLESC